METQKVIPISEYDYELPKELIAQKPSEKRENCKMMVLDRNEQTIEHKHFYDITEYFDENDVIVLNNTKVIPARLLGKKIPVQILKSFCLNR